MAIVMNGFAVGADVQQGLDQGNVACGGGHQWRLVHLQTMRNTVLATLLKDVLEVLVEIIGVTLSYQGRDLLRKTARLIKIRFGV